MPARFSHTHFIKKLSTQKEKKSVNSALPGWSQRPYKLKQQQKVPYVM